MTRPTQCLWKVACILLLLSQFYYAEESFDWNMQVDGDTTLPEYLPSSLELEYLRHYLQKQPNPSDSKPLDWEETPSSDTKESIELTTLDLETVESKYNIPMWSRPDQDVVWEATTDVGDVDLFETESIRITVNNLQDDYPPSSSYCFTSFLIQPQLCNLRSAWLSCLSLNTTTSTGLPTTCQIILPPVASLYLNQTYGQLEANQVPTPFTIQIIGNKATITSKGSRKVSPNPRRISGLPYSTGSLSNTNSAKSTKSCLVPITVCSGMMITIATNSYTGDTIIRLLNAEQQEITNVDDQLGFGSLLTYYIPTTTTTSSSSSCNPQSYYLKLGCYQNTTCSMTVTGNYSMGFKPRFLMYQQLPQVSSSRNALVISNLTLTGFGHTSLNGGCLYIEGPLNLTLQQVIFRNHVGNFGGGLFMNYNTQPVNIKDCQFYQQYAYGQGGSVYFDKNNTKIVMNRNLMNQSTSRNYMYNPATMVMNVLNSITIKQLQVRYSHSIIVNPTNIMLVMKEIVLFKSRRIYVDNPPLATFSIDGLLSIGCSAGSLFIGNSNNNQYYPIFLNNFTIIGQKNPTDSESILFYQPMLQFRDIYCINVSTCLYSMGNLNLTNFIAWNSVVRAIGLYYSFDTLLYTTILTNLTILGDQSGIRSSSSSSILSIRSSDISCFSYTTRKNPIIIQQSTLKYGNGVIISGIPLEMKHTSITYSAFSGLYLSSTTKGILTNVTLAYNQAAGGGGLLLQSTNNITLIGCAIHHNTATTIGGGGILYKQNNTNTLLIDQYSYSKAGYFYYEYTTVSPGQIVFQQDFTIPNITNYLLKVNQITIGNEATLTILVDGVMKYAYVDIYVQIVALLGGCDNINQDPFFQLFCLPGLQIATKILQGKKITIQLQCSYNAPIVITTPRFFDISIIPIYPPEVIQSQQPSSSLTRIYSNQALTGGGGGISMITSNKIQTMLNVDIAGNLAYNSGGGMFVQLSNRDYTMFQVSIANNTAMTYGGGVYFQTGNNFITIMNSTISSNHAKTNNGGGLMLLSSNGASSGIALVLTILNNVITGNEAQQSGGGMYFGDGNFVIVKSNLIANNIAHQGSGGGCFMDQSNQINHTYTRYINNTAEVCGGGISIANQNVLFFTNNSFIRNYAHQVGGGLCSQSNALLFFNQSQYFIANQAMFGGGIAVIDNYIWKMVLPTSATSSLQPSHLYLLENVASRGSALFIKGLLRHGINSHSLQNITIGSNHARFGGTIYWIYDSSMQQEPPGVHAKSVVFVNNTALYGIQIATQAIVLQAPLVYQVMNYGSLWSEAIVIQLYDVYQQPVIISNDTYVYPTLLTSTAAIKHSNGVARMATPPSCGSFIPYLSGNNILGIPMQHGNARFTELQGLCQPNGNYTIQFTAKLGDHLGYGIDILQDYYLVNFTLISFRNCESGEYEKNGECIVCPQGKYSLVTPVESCLDCTKTTGIEDCYGNQIIVASGYWRRFPTNTAVLACLLGKTTGSSCMGGNITGDALCAIGYTGPLCAVCEEGYYSSGSECITCEGTSAISPATIVLLVVAPVAVIVILSVLYYKESQATASSAVTTAVGAIATQTVFDQWYAWWKARYADMMVRTKIIASTYQIVAATGTIFDITMPTGFTSFANAFNFLNFGLTSIFPIGCATNFNFMTTLLWTTMSPLLLLLLLVVCLLVELLWLQQQLRRVDTTRYIPSFSQLLSPANTMTECIAIKQKYLNYLFYITYLILPSTTTTIFKTFICTNIDPNQEDQEHYDWYLVADMSISCESPYYYHWLIYAVFMILLYPIGIPVMYFTMLYYHREEIRTRDTLVDVVVVVSKHNASRDTAIDDKEDGSSGTENGQGGVEASQQMSENEAQHQDTAGNKQLESVAVQTSTANSTTTATPTPPNKPAAVTTITQTTTKQKPTLSPNVVAITFLFGSYASQYWYWELIETYRRIFLTAVVSVIQPGTPEQNVISILFAIFFIRLYGAYQPYGKERNNILAEMGQVQIFFTFFMALLIQSDVLSNAWMAVGDVLLVWLNVGVMFVVLYFQYQVYVEKVAVTPWQRFLLILNLVLTSIRGMWTGLRDLIISSRSSDPNEAVVAQGKAVANPLNSDDVLEGFEEIEMGTIQNKK